MGVTYGYDAKRGDTFVTSMQRASDIFGRLGAPELAVLSVVFPFGGLLPSNSVLLDRSLICICCSEGVASVVSGNGVQVRDCRMPASGVRGRECTVCMDQTTRRTSRNQ